MIAPAPNRPAYTAILIPYTGFQSASQPPKMALKKSELYSSLWSSCDELRGGMDASQYKDYVLVLLFIKYISDKYAGRTR